MHMNEVRPLDIYPFDADRDRLRSFQPPLEVFNVKPSVIDTVLGTVTRTGGQTAQFYPLHPVYVFHADPALARAFGLPTLDVAVLWDGTHFYDLTEWHGAHRFEALLNRWREAEKMAGSRALNPTLSFKERQAMASALRRCATELLATIVWQPTTVTPMGGENGSSQSEKGDARGAVEAGEAHAARAEDGGLAGGAEGALLPLDSYREAGAGDSAAFNGA